MFRERVKNASRTAGAKFASNAMAALRKPISQDRHTSNNHQTLLAAGLLYLALVSGNVQRQALKLSEVAKFTRRHHQVMQANTSTWHRSTDRVKCS